MREPISKKLRFQVLRRDRFACRYCGAQAGDAKLHIDHRVPVKHGGKTVISNLYTACQPCNLGKGTMDVEDVPIPAAVLMEMKFLEGAHFALGHTDMPQDWWSFLVGFYESGRDFAEIREGIRQQMLDNQADLDHAYPGIDSNMGRPSYMRLAQEWVNDPSWRQYHTEDEIRQIREWRPN